jgi:hypothetical protein
MTSEPFGSRHPVDMIVGVRAQLFVIAAMTTEVERCSENCFQGQNNEEAAVLITATNEKLTALLSEVQVALEFLREAEDRKSAA